MTERKTHWSAADRSQKDAEPATRRANAALAARLPFDDRSDFTDARRGFMGTHVDGVIRTAKGTPVWNLPAYP